MSNKKLIEKPNLNITYFGYVITDTKYNIKYHSKTFLHFIKDSKYKDIINKKITVFFSNIKPDKIDELYEIKSVNNAKYYVIKNYIKLYDNKLYLMFFYDFSISDELEKQLDYLSRQQYLYNEMLNKLEEGIYITNEEGKTLFVNDAFVNLSGLNRDLLIGKTVYNLRKDKILPNSCCAKVIETKNSVSTINNYYEGQKCLVSGSPIIDEQGNFKRTIAVIRDVSELDMLMKNIAKEDSLSISYTRKIDVNKNNTKQKELIVSNNAIMKSIYKKVKKVANVDSTILILGETGVGKDFLASYIHSMSERSVQGNLIKINCGAIPEPLMESELFGYEEGAFTGAQKGGKKGLFEEANKGTVFLDEIGDMPYTLQVKLLNAINDRIYYRIGGNKQIQFDARIIAATNADLNKLVVEKKFRADLYYRLNVVKLIIPPLRQRKEDILPLIQQFLEYYNNKYRRNCFFSSNCLENFLMYNWPGNIREMKNLIERLVLMSDDACIDSDLFKEQIVSNEGDMNADEIFIQNNDQSLKKRMEIYEKAVIEKTIFTTKTLKEAADKLEIDISTLVRKKQKYNIN